jgi:hypothetical protein
MADGNICSRCVLTKQEGVRTFDALGRCNLCLEVEDNYKRVADKSVRSLPKTIKAHTKFDCVIGVSGGLDSSFVLLKAVEKGYRPLAVHFDAGWDTHLATQNIYNLVNNLNVHYVSDVLDWDEYKRWQTAFFCANVPDIELLYDNLMLSCLYRYAAKYKVKYIFAGTNTAAEGIRIPREFSWFKWDKKNILSIGRSQGIKPQNLKFISLIERFKYRYLYGIKWINFLDCINYDTCSARAELRKKCNYIPYERKHSESFFTDFYQRIILPQKFGFDKRRIHLSSLILSGQITRDKALQILETGTELDHISERNSEAYFLSKLNFSPAWFAAYLKQPSVHHARFKNDWSIYIKVVKFLKDIKNCIR